MVMPDIKSHPLLFTLHASASKPTATAILKPRPNTSARKNEGKTKKQVCFRAVMSAT